MVIWFATILACITLIGWGLWFAALLNGLRVDVPSQIEEVEAVILGTFLLLGLAMLVHAVASVGHNPAPAVVLAGLGGLAARRRTLAVNGRFWGRVRSLESRLRRARRLHATHI